ncbi:hypothetical protein [Nocardiopsis composta]|uniref:Aryl-alcohol dehydrogenase-like predicted oxidoreductase n=1 Tax=Nocardiopsis composta TaxID=157465 RepID=A0A7W8VFN2_9ACTN|nr:aryl-alcohol dehydrogenase-like predicted oxidoreductase [Nocardiopsis composta]
MDADTEAEDAMRYRMFGNSGLRVSEVHLGAMGFGWTDRDEVRRMVDLYTEANGQ